MYSKTQLTAPSARYRHRCGVRSASCKQAIEIQQHIIRKRRQQEGYFNPWRTESRDQFQVYVQAQPFEESSRGSLARPDTSDVPRLAWNASDVGDLEAAPAPVTSQKQHVDSRTSVTGSRQQRRRKKMSAKALASSRYLSNTTVCATDKKTNTKKPFHLYGWGNTRPVGRTAFLGSNYMKSKNTAAKSLPPAALPPAALLTAPGNPSHGESQVGAIVLNTENNSQPSVFGPSTVGSMIQPEQKRSRLNVLQESSAPSFSSGSRPPVPPGAPTQTASRAFARKTKKQNAVIDRMVHKWEPKGFRIDCNPQNYSHLPRTWTNTIPVAGTTIPVSKRDSVASLLLQV